MTKRLAACAAIVIGAALTLRAAEVTEAEAKAAGCKDVSIAFWGDRII